MPLEHDVSSGLEGYLDLVRKRATGQVKTNARWIREFVAGHAEYAGGSVVGDRVAYDLLVAIKEMQ
jgi:glutamate--cysteine ligase catalytic subunit